ncbi:MAG: hypothetical protein JO046_18445, partial [Solirubrobacterales bacterium]|nr:hypothetical protein [Solirubrobacterales bacterium]
WQLKLATGVDRHRAERTGTGAPLWAVRLGSGGQPLAIALANGTPTPFATRPLSNVLQSGAENVLTYSTGKGLGQPSTNWAYAGIDLDTWMRELLAAVDGLLAPAYATAVGLIDSKLPDGRKGHLQELADTKKALAGALKLLAIPVLENADPPDSSTAQGLLEQELLIQLGNFYTTDALVQFEVTATSEDTDPQLAPQLFGTLSQVGDVQPVTLSDPKVPLATPGQHQPPSTLTFMLTSGQTDIAQTEASVTVDLTYGATNIEHQIGSIVGILDYKASSWLAFVMPESAAPLGLNLGTFTVPLVLHGFPTPPSMLSQSGQQTTPDGTPDLTLEQTLSWDYGFTYSVNPHYQQDTVHLTLEFNHQQQGVKALETGAGSVIAALAQFVTAYPAVNDDLEQYVALVDPAKLDPESQNFVNADVALSTFTQMANDVAGTVSHVGLAGKRARLGDVPLETYDLSISESSVKLPSKLDPRKSVPALLVTVQNVPAKLQSTVEVAIPGCTAQAPPITEKASVQAGPSSYSYVFVQDSTQDWLPASEGELIPPRALCMRNLNVLARQDAWVSASLGRNENAAEPFRYKTPDVFFASPQYPTNLYTHPLIEIATIGGAGPQVRTPEQQPQVRTPEQQLQALFQALFAAAPAGEQTLQLECRYQYTLTDSDLGPMSLPVYMLPATEVDPATELKIPVGGCPTDRTQGPLLCRLAGAIRTWWAGNQPSTLNGLFTFDLTVMSQLTSQPVIRLENLQLGQQWIDWSS